jgi:uncharacterized Tic20 family protein
MTSNGAQDRRDNVMKQHGMNESNDNREARNWGMLCHLTALAGFIGIPFGHILGPLVVWLLKKNDYPSVDEQGKESLNFQISLSIYGIISALLIFVMVGIFLLIVLILADLILVIVASVKTSNGESYRYPLTIRFIK